MSIESKKQEFKEAFDKFLDIEWYEDSGATPDEWIHLFCKVNQVLKPGDGLLWGDIKEIITERLK